MNTYDRCARCGANYDANGRPLKLYKLSDDLIANAKRLGVRVPRSRAPVCLCCREDIIRACQLAPRQYASAT